MELKRYLGLVLKRWKLVAVVALAAVLAAGVMTAGGDSTFESSGTYVVRPKVLDPDETVRATEALNRGGEINTTYARIARSEIVRTRAREALADAGVESSDLSAISKVVPGSNILEIGARGADPEAVTAYATALGEETARYLAETGELYEILPLDNPDLPERPEPTRRALTLLLSVVAGVVAGAGLAFGVEYLREPASAGQMNLTDPVTGAYRREYFRLRLREELARCRPPESERPATRNAGRRANERSSLRKVNRQAQQRPPVPAYRFSLGLVKVAGEDPAVAPDPHGHDLREVARSLRTALREHDVLSFVGDRTFAVIFPSMAHDDAVRTLEGWRTRAEHDRHLRHLTPSVLVCECSDDAIVGDEEGMRVARAV